MPPGNSINSKEYWDHRFASGDWESNGGRWQTAQLAMGYLPFLRIPRDFPGSILDFGCGLGDAIPILKEAFPSASIFGVELSEEATNKCRAQYGDMAHFIVGDHQNVPKVDVIIVSNVLEHLKNDREVALHLRSLCTTLYIIVPFKERLMIEEHVNRYDTRSFDDLGPHEYHVFTTRGWSYYGRELWYHQYFKNIGRLCRGEPLHFQRRQIIFRIPGAISRPE